MKKKQRCFVKRFAALVASLMLCASLCVPAFASNNAQWRKWRITAERQMETESGSSGKFFQLTPFQNGAVYAATFTSHSSFIALQSPNSSGSSVSNFNSGVIICDNYPDWWRSAIPLGNRSYVQFDVKTLESSSTYTGSRSPVSSATLSVFDSNNAIVMSALSNGNANSSQNAIYTAGAPAAFFGSLGTNASQSGSGDYVSTLQVSSGQSYLFSPNDMYNLVLGFGSVPQSDTVKGPSYSRSYLSNLTSDRIVFGFTYYPGYLHCSAEVTYWVDANKLPAGLKVGDEFPADTDAFDQLRDELIDQFPEASENIQNGKSTLTGWNDTETVDTDVASSAMSALNAMFQNLGSFLFIVSLMVFGAVVLRMFIKKAVDG